MTLEYRVKKFVEALLTWGKKSSRSFPWRKTSNPYKILIAEIMLQRTRADQVIPVFREFISSYPSPHALVDAPLSDIRDSIRSLGLEKRAFGLKRLAEQLVKDHNGRVPSDKVELIRLYGVGNYIANAVLCHAYGVEVPTVDANFARVLKRVFSLQSKEPAQKDRNFWSFAEHTMTYARGHSRALNLAVIDLASLICTPKNPKCPKCLLNKICDYASKANKT